MSFIKYLGGVVSGTSVFALLGTLIELIIPEGQRTQILIESIYLTRQINEEPTNDSMELISEEFVLDSFGIDDKQALQKEIASQKQSHASWSQFKAEFRTWKVAWIVLN